MRSSTVRSRENPCSFRCWRSMPVSAACGTRPTISDSTSSTPALAADAGVELVESEIVGLVPQAALTGIDLQHLKLQGFSRDLTVEERIRQAIAARGSRARQQGGFSM